MPERRNTGRSPRSAAHLPPNDQRLVQQIEDLYGPPRWKWPGRRANTAIDSASPWPAAAKPALAPLALRTLLVAAAAFLSWYALLGGDVSVQRTLSLIISSQGGATGTLRPPSPMTAEYQLAAKTLSTTDLAVSDPLVLQFKALLDGLAPKCKEDRFRLAAAVMAADDVLRARGIRESYLSILSDVDTGLSDQTRRSWPTSCTDVINRIVSARIGSR